MTKKQQRLLLTLLILGGGSYLVWKNWPAISGWFQSLSNPDPDPQPGPDNDQGGLISAIQSLFASLFGGGADPDDTSGNFWESAWTAATDWFTNLDLNPGPIDINLPAGWEDLLGQDLPEIPGIEFPAISPALGGGLVGSATGTTGATAAAAGGSKLLAITQLQQIAAQGLLPQAIASAAVPLLIGLHPDAPKIVGNVGRQIDQAFGLGPADNAHMPGSGYIKVTNVATGKVYWKGYGDKAGTCKNGFGKVVDCP